VGEEVPHPVLLISRENNSQTIWMFPLRSLGAGLLIHIKPSLVIRVPLCDPPLHVSKSHTSGSVIPLGNPSLVCGFVADGAISLRCPDFVGTTRPRYVTQGHGQRMPLLTALLSVLLTAFVRSLLGSISAEIFKYTVSTQPQEFQLIPPIRAGIWKTSKHVDLNFPLNFV